MARRTNPYAGWTQFARGYFTQGNNVPTFGNSEYAPGNAPYQGLSDYASGYTAGHPQPKGPPGTAADMYFSGLAKQQAANPPPFDSIYENAISGLNRQYGDTSAQINYDESQLSPTYGYKTDTGGNVTVDPSNPFSKAALLQRSYDQGQAGTTNRMASQGQLYSGATQNALNQGTFQNQSATDALKRAYQQAVQGIGQRRRVASTNQYIGTTGAQGDAIARALANRPTQ